MSNPDIETYKKDIDNIFEESKKRLDAIYAENDKRGAEIWKKYDRALNRLCLGIALIGVALVIGAFLFL